MSRPRERAWDNPHYILMSISPATTAMIHPIISFVGLAGTAPNKDLIVLIYALSIIHSNSPDSLSDFFHYFPKYTPITLPGHIVGVSGMEI